jgi:N-acetyltransferase 10
VWRDAEEQVKKGKGSSNVVSVKSSKQKRKAGQTADEVYNEAFGEKKHKKHKKPKK